MKVPDTAPALQTCKYQVPSPDMQGPGTPPPRHATALALQLYMMLRQRGNLSPTENHSQAVP